MCSSGSCWTAHNCFLHRAWMGRKPKSATVPLLERCCYWPKLQLQPLFWPASTLFWLSLHLEKFSVQCNCSLCLLYGWEQLNPVWNLTIIIKCNGLAIFTDRKGPALMCSLFFTKCIYISDVNDGDGVYVNHRRAVVYANPSSSSTSQDFHTNLDEEGDENPTKGTKRQTISKVQRVRRAR